MNPRRGWFLGIKAGTTNERMFKSLDKAGRFAGIGGRVFREHHGYWCFVGIVRG